MNRWILSSALVLALVGTGCNGGSSDAASNAAGQNKAGDGKPGDSKAPQNVLGELKELKIEDSEPGTGKEGAKPGDLVAVQYKGYLGNGTVFDTNMGEDKEPFMLVLGQGMVIQGWEQGLIGVKPGTKRKISIPWKLGYGEQGSGEKIPPRTDLYFDVVIQDVVKKDDQQVVVVKDIKVGSGKEAKSNSMVTFHYVATYPGGKIWDTTKKEGKPISQRLGQGALIPGLDSGIEGMKVGGKRKIKVPPMVGFGPSGRAGVPPNMILNFEVELLNVQ